MLTATDTIGRKVKSRKGIVDTATEYYKELYSSTLNDITNQVQAYTNLEVDEEVPPIITSEIRTALRELKKRKTSGEDGLLTNVLN